MSQSMQASLMKAHLSGLLVRRPVCLDYGKGFDASLRSLTQIALDLRYQS